MENSCPRGLKIKLSHRLQHLIRVQALESSDLKENYELCCHINRKCHSLSCLVAIFAFDQC